MRAFIALAFGLALASPSGAAKADDPFAGLPAETVGLDTQRGGTEISNSVLQNNETTQSGANTGDISIGSNAAKINGSIREATVTGNHGITAVMQNTGDLVNMNNATSVNVFLQ